MDLPKAPTHEDVHNISGIWNWIVFFVGLIFSGGLLEYVVSKRYVTRKEWEEKQKQCSQHLQDQFEIALLRNNERLEQRMVEAIAKTLREEISEIKK